MSRNILYRHYDKNDVLLYLGISLTLFQRLADHKLYSIWFNEVTKITVERFNSEKNLLIAEKKAIKNEKPLYNIQHSDLKKIIEIKPILNVTKTAELIGVSRYELYRMIKDGRFDVKPIKGTKPPRWNADHVEAWKVHQ